MYFKSVARSSVPDVIPEAVAVEYSFKAQPIPLGAGIPVQFDRFPLAGVPRAGVTSVGDVALTSPPVPVDVAPQRVSTIAPTVVSSRTVLAAAVIVAVSGTPVEAVVLPINWS